MFAGINFEKRLEKIRESKVQIEDQIEDQISLTFTFTNHDHGVRNRTRGK